MISRSSCLASSQPATSLKVIFLPWGVKSFARDLPKDRALFPPLCIWRMKKIQMPMNRRIGAHIIRLRKTLLSLGFSASTFSPFSRRSSRNFSSLTMYAT